ncbi:protein shisa-9 isoform X2 [Pleurodeles waltl]|uniref:protein shisa-9 isoform X2 n=1 Tax=Pleurodeles waltl TaxID=8319 RepID=UPI003709AE67
MKANWAIFGYFLVDLFSSVCWAQGKPGQHFGSIVVVSGGNHSSPGDPGSSDTPQATDACRGYFDVMGQWDPPFNCSSGEFIFCCGTCGFRFCCKFKQASLDQTTCTNYDRPIWLNAAKPPPRIDDPLHDPTRDKTNLIVYIICGVVAVMVLVGIFTKLGLEKAHRPQRENMSRALADVMRQGDHYTAEHMERDASLAVHVQHYENMQPRPPANNLRGTLLHGTLTDKQDSSHHHHSPLHLQRVGGREGEKNDTAHMNNVVPASPLLPQIAHPHSYPTMGPISNPYEQQPPGKELNKYASLKAVAEKSNDDFYSKRRHLAELAAKGSLPLHPVRVEQDRSYSPDTGTMKQNGQKPKITNPHSHPLAYSSDLKSWEHNEHSLRRQAYANKKHCPPEPASDQMPVRNQHFLPPQPYFVTNSKTEVTV